MSSNDGDGDPTPYSGEESASDVDSDGGGFIEREAVESGESSAEEDFSDEFDTRSRSMSEDIVPFEYFMKLPIELRLRVWSFFCPSLDGCPLWLQFGATTMAPYQLPENLRSDPDLPYTTLFALTGDSLGAMTYPSRALLAVHQESRHFALKAHPDELAVNFDGVVRFDSHRDLVALEDNTMFFQLITQGYRPGFELVANPMYHFSAHIRHLVLDGVSFTTEGRLMIPGYATDQLGTHIIPLLLSFPKLETLYVGLASDDVEDSGIRWCSSDYTRSVAVEIDEELEGLEYTNLITYVWPNTGKVNPVDLRPIKPHHPFRYGNISHLLVDVFEASLANDLREQWDKLDARSRLANVEVWPAVHFMAEVENRRLEMRRIRTNGNQSPVRSSTPESLESGDVYLLQTLMDPDDVESEYDEDDGFVVADEHFPTQSSENEEPEEFDSDDNLGLDEDDDDLHSSDDIGRTDLALRDLPPQLEFSSDEDEHDGYGESGEGEDEGEDGESTRGGFRDRENDDSDENDDDPDTADEPLEGVSIPRRAANRRIALDSDDEDEDDE